ncbi:MAG: hypothetical protein E7488_05970 [Ruminococcaceae bacterium]|nr:hypothetical protein [Oscillospiraceae bacterium]
MRKFKLINANGQEFDLMRKDAFFYNISGLGFGIEADYTRIGSKYFASDEREKQPMPGGTISFAGYRQHDEFRAFCRVGGLVLAFKQLDTWYYLDVNIDITHSDISKDTHRLECEIRFIATSHWYEKVTASKAQEDTSIGKVYPYTYPYTYSNGRPGIIDVEGGNLPSSCKIHIFGPCTNPAFTITKGGQRVADGRFFVELLKGRKLVINSDPVEMEVAEYTTNNDYIADRYADSDFETDRIVEVPAGSSRFTFTQEGSGAVIAFVEVKKLV